MKYQRLKGIHKEEGGCDMEVKQYDIVQANLSGIVGSEQGGTRPVLIVQNDVGNMRSSCTIGIPFSSQLKKINQPTHTLIKKSCDTGLKTDSILLGEQMRAISKKRITKKIGSVTDEEERKEIRRVYYANFGE